MKKILIIACGLMLSSLSAMTLPDHVQVVNYEKITIQKPMELFAYQVLGLEDYVVSDFFVQPQNIVQLQTFRYVHDIDVVDREGFIKPILYESFYTFLPLTNYDLYKVRVPIRNEVLLSNRIRDVSKTLVV
jgi:hypothetical protein